MRYFSAFYDDAFSKVIPQLRTESWKALFIMGSGRNGSTLFSCILNNHNKICIPPEHNGIPAAIRYWHTHPFQSWTNKVNHITSIFEKSALWNFEGEKTKSELSGIPVNQRNINEIINSIYGYFGRKQGKLNPVWGDKTPSNNHFIKTIKKQFPLSKIIFLVRDPRDVVSSLLEINEKHFLKTFDFLLWRWIDSIDKYRFLSKKFPEDIRMLKYENLVSNPSEEVTGIIRWLDLEPQPGLLNSYAANMEFLGIKDVEHHKNINNPISTGSIGKWKYNLAKESVTKIHRRLGATMKQLGYI
jgi:hypothetical protein